MMKNDTVNKLLVTCGNENLIRIQLNSIVDTLQYRTLINPLGKDEDILFSDVSFYLNSIATANDQCILLYNFENLKL